MSKHSRRWTRNRLFSRRWWLCLSVCGVAAALDIAGRPLDFGTGSAISGIAVALISMQTWLDSGVPTSGHWTPHRTLSRKWTTGVLTIGGLFGLSVYGLVLDSATLSVVAGVMGSWIGSQTYLDYRAGKAQKENDL